MFTAKRSSFNLTELLNAGKVVLINCNKKHLVTKDNVRFVGAFFSAEINRLAFNRSGSVNRLPIFIYLDEFQNFANSQTHEMLEECRKYGIHLCLAHQNINQIKPDLMNSILGNTSVKFCGGVNSKDQSLMSSNLAFKIHEVNRLERGRFVVGVKGRKTKVIQFPNFLALPSINEGNSNYINKDQWTALKHRQFDRFYTRFQNVNMDDELGNVNGFSPHIQNFGE
jgi:hypothetical protein